MDAQVAVIGVGSTGSMALWRLARAGVAVHGFEQFGIPHDRSAAGGESRMFRASSLKDPRYVDYSLSALDLWQELEKDSQRDLLTVTGELVVGPEEAPGIVTSLRCCRDFGLKHEELDTADLRQRFPQHRVSEGECGVLDLNGGFVRPELAVLAAARRAETLGAVLHLRTPVQSVEPEGDGVRVRTDGRTYRFERVVLASGPWIRRLVPRLRRKVQVRRPVQAWFAVDNPAAYSPERFPVFLRTGRGESCYGFPTLDGVTIKLGLSAIHNRVVPDPDALERTVSLREAATFSDVVTEFLPGLHPDPVRLAAYMEGYTVDNRPIIGMAPESDRMVLLTGFSGHGFKFAPAFGEVAARLLIDGSAPLDIEPFSPGRDLEDWPA